MDQIPADRLAIVARQPADRSNAQPLSLQLLNLLHVFPPQHRPAPPLSRVGCRVQPLSGVGDFSFGTMRIFAPALTLIQRNPAFETSEPTVWVCWHAGYLDSLF